MSICRQNRFGSAKRQRFRIGDIVWMPVLNCEAVVLGSIRDLVRDSPDYKFYKVRFENGEESAWHHQNEMKLVEKLEYRWGGW